MRRLSVASTESTIQPTASISRSEPAPKARRTRPFEGMPTLWKAMIITSFVMNMVLLLVLLLVGGLVLQNLNPITGTTFVVQGFARENVQELRDVVTKLQGATIRTTIPLDQPLPLQGAGVSVPVNQDTTVTLIEDVPLVLTNADIDLGNGNRLRANAINLNLPAGTPLKINLNMQIPLDEVTIPVRLQVPVEIPLKDTELGPEFDRLGALVDRLVAPVSPLLGINMDEPAKPEK